MKRTIVIIVLFTLLLSACNFPGRQVIPTPSSTATLPAPTETSIPQPGKTATPQAVAVTSTSTPSPTPTITPTEANTEEFILANYDKLALDYNPDLWMSEKGMGQGMLIHLTISGCEITDQGPTEPPRDLQSAEVGEITFNTAEFPSANGNLTFTWYILQSGINNPYKAQGTVPILIVQSPKQDNDACVKDASTVLETLHPVVP